jgi:hypothetical protein
MSNTILHITPCRARKRVYALDTDTKPECRWLPDGTGEAVGYSCTACGQYVDAGSTTGLAIAAASGASSPMTLPEIHDRHTAARSFRGRPG